ncbi:MAG: Asp-tRNA(Asn)/Glu-tRNA(Gln) amidotransferase subunit GatC [Patescibacteria group bacterium]|nr:Asp-tRNA(Asn)/Glu-tRNA(Gln) amidotransferase subunit GatC [Patescibacteria group bacterium]
MATTEEVKKLAALARISISEGELENFTKEFDSILAYVGQLEKLELPETGEQLPPLRNVMREDGEPHESGKFTEKLVEQFPEKEGAYLKVKQIISND